MSNTFSVGQVVKGIVAGTFVVIAFRQIDGEDYAQVKPVGPRGQLGRGEFSLPLSALRAA